MSGSAANRQASATPENVFLFVPNIIGYVRIVLVMASLYYMPVHPRTCSILYCVSCLLDALDGAAARYFKQSTRFGAVLDMVTDRCSTTCLLVFLSSAFPRWSIVFQCLISLDYTSHYMHMYTTLAVGGSSQSHKEMDKNRPWVMRIYYSDTRVLFIVCALNELFFVALYLLSFSSPLFTPLIDLESGLPDGSATAISQLWTTPWSAGAMELARANKVDDTIPWILLYASSLFMLFKQYVNVVQLLEASKLLVQGDIAMRKKARRAESKRNT